MKVGEIVAVMRLDMTQYREGLARATSLLKEHSQYAGQAIMLLSGFGSAVAGGFALASGKAIEFEGDMRNVNSILKESEEGFSAMSEAVLNMAGKVGQAPATLAKGLYDIASSGFEGADGLQILEASAKAAVAGITDTATAARAATAVLNSYGMAASEVGRVQDILFKGVEVGVFTYADLAQNLGDFVSTAAQAGVKLEEVIAAYSTITRAGVMPAEAATSINQAMMAMISPSAEAVDAAKKLGIEWNATHLRAVGLLGVMQELSTAVKLDTSDMLVLKDATLTDAQAMDILNKRHGSAIEMLAALFANVRALRGALPLVANGARGFAGDVDKMANSSGAAAAALAEQSKSLRVQWQQTWAGISAYAIRAGSDILTALRPLVATLKAVTAVANAVPAPLRIVATVIALVSAALASGTAAWILYTVAMKQAGLVGLSFMGATLQMLASLPGVTAVLWGLRQAALVAAISLEALWAAMGPVGWVIAGIAAIAALAGGIALYGRHQAAANKEGEKTNRLTDEQITKAKALFEEERRLRLARESRVATGAQPDIAAVESEVKVRNQLAELFPEMVAGYNAEGNAILLTVKALKDLNEEERKLLQARRARAVEAQGAAAQDLSDARDRLDAITQARKEFEATGKVSAAAAQALLDTGVFDLQKLADAFTNATDMLQAYRAVEGLAAEDVRKANTQYLARADAVRRLSGAEKDHAAAIQAAAALSASAKQKLLEVEGHILQAQNRTHEARMKQMAAEAMAMRQQLTDEKIPAARVNQLVAQYLAAARGELVRQEAEAARTAEQQWADAIKGHEGEIAGARARAHRIRMDQIHAEAADLYRNVAIVRGAGEAELEARQYVLAKSKELAKEEADARARIFEDSAKHIITVWQEAIDSLRGFDQANLAAQKSQLEALYNAGAIGASSYANELGKLQAVEGYQATEYVRQLGRILDFMQQADRARAKMHQQPLFRQDEARLAQTIFDARKQMVADLATAEKSLADKRKQWAEQELELQRKVHQHELSMIELQYQYQRDLATLRGDDTADQAQIAAEQLRALDSYRRSTTMTAQENLDVLERMRNLVLESAKAEYGGMPGAEAAGWLRDIFDAMKQARAQLAAEEERKAAGEHYTTGTEIEQAERQVGSLREQIAATVGAFGQALDVMQKVGQFIATMGGLQVVTPEQLDQQRTLLRSWLADALGAIMQTGGGIGQVAARVFGDIRQQLEGLGKVRLQPALAGAVAGGGAGGPKTYNFYYNGRKVGGDTDINKLMDQIAAALEREQGGKGD